MNKTEEQIHLRNSKENFQDYQQSEWESLSIDDFQFAIKKITSERGKVTVTLESQMFSNEDIGTLMKMQHQGDGLVSCAIHALKPEESSQNQH